MDFECLDLKLTRLGTVAKAMPSMKDHERHVHLSLIKILQTFGFAPS